MSLDVRVAAAPRVPHEDDARRYDAPVESSEPPNPPEANPPPAAPDPRAKPVPNTTFDVAFGIVLPIACLIADPGILRSLPLSLLGPPLLAPFAAAAYVVILPAFVVLAVWLAWPRAALLLAGPLFAGGAVAFAIGVALLPISLPACVVLIGLLGLVPFVTAFVYVRNGLRALRTARAAGASRSLVLVSLLFLVCFGAAYGAQWHVDGRVAALVEAATAGDDRRTDAAVEALRPFRWIADAAPALAAVRAAPKDRAERLERAWLDATGHTLREVVD